MILFGVVVILYVLLIGLAVALPFGLLVSYLIAGASQAKRGAELTVGGRLWRQTLAFLLAWVLGIVCVVILSFTTMEGDAGQGVDVFGMEMGEGALFAVPLALAALVVVLGEVALFAQRRLRAD